MGNKMRVNIFCVFITILTFNSGNVFATDGVSCSDSSVNYDLCKSGVISKIIYRTLNDSALISGVSAPGCGTGWVLKDVSKSEYSKLVYSTLLAVKMSKSEVSISRVGSLSCTKWDGDWKGVVTEVSVN
jgi:hypothetical protein